MHSDPPEPINQKDCLTEHASCVCFGQTGILILGASGSGKSCLAIDLIDAGASLVADDQTDVTHHAGQLYASAPKTIPGLIEIYGVGLMRMPYTEKTPLTLACKLVAPLTERLPQYAADNTVTYFGINLPLIYLHTQSSSLNRSIIKTVLRDDVHGRGKL